MLDQSKTGIITAENLYEELRRLDSEITFSEVEDVLKKVDKDGNGEIDFDEFLVHMTNMGDLFGDDEGGGITILCSILIDKLISIKKIQITMMMFAHKEIVIGFCLKYW